MIGKNIQRIRKQQNLTLDALSLKSGVSKAMLSQIESDKVNPTVATVWKISQGLEVEINELLAGSPGPSRKFHVTPRKSITQLETDEEGLHMNVLTPIDMAEDLEMYMLTFASGGILDSAPHFLKTEEFLTVISGSVRVRAGENVTELKTGDFIRYDCDVEHSIENLADTVSVVHMVVRFNKKHWE